MSTASPLRRRLTQMYYAAVKVVCPGLRNSQFAYREVLASSVGATTAWLDLGCGHQFFPDWMPDAHSAQEKLVRASASVIGVDAGDLRPHTCGIEKIAADIEHLPFSDSTFSLVTANMVVEHVANPELLLREVTRVLVPGGLFLFHTPNAKYFEVAIGRLIPSGIIRGIASLLDGRASDDIFPTHYRLNTARQIRDLSTKCGLSIQSLKHEECTAQGVMLGPLVIFELLIIRLLRLAALENYRSDLLVVLQKPQGQAVTQISGQNRVLAHVAS